jgi:hypothetical protein
MQYPRSKQYFGWTGQGLCCLSRVLGQDAALLTQASITSITWHVVNAVGTQTGSGTLTVADVIYDSAQTGNGWPHNDGYNFRYVVPGASFPAAGCYQVEFHYTPATGEGFADVFPNVEIQELKGS